MKIYLLTLILFLSGAVAAEENTESAKKFVSTIIKSLADGGKKVAFPLADKIIAIDNGEVIASEQFKKAWPEFAKMAFKKDTPKASVVSKLHIDIIPAKGNKILLENRKLMKIYKPQEGDFYCNASKANDSSQGYVNYRKAFIYIIRKTKGGWQLLAIGG